jgi:quinol monooxygenase YgiN
MESAVIQSQVRMVLPAERLEEALKVLLPLVERTRVERGCLGCQLHRDVQEAQMIILEESWATRADLDRHLRSPRYKHLLLVMEMASAPPEVRFDQVSGTSGLETIEGARKESETW